MYKNKTQKGFTLIEVLTALFVFSVGLMAVVQLYSQLVQRAVENKDFFLGAALANEGVELVMLARNDNIVSGTLAFDGMPNNRHVCLVSVTDPLDCTVGVGNANIFRLERIGSPEYFSHGSGSSPTFWRRVYLVRHDNSTPGDKTDDEMEVVSLVSWSSGYTFPNVNDVESGIYSCSRNDKCLGVRTILSQP